MIDTTSSVRMTTGTRLYLYVSLSLVAMLVLLPLVTTALGGFKSLGDLRVNPFGLPSEWLWSNYLDILFGDRYWRQMLNSLFIATVTVVLTVIVSAMAAFTFAHVKFFGANQLLNYFLIGLMFLRQPRSCRFSSASAISACSTPIGASSCLRSPSASA